ncbi:unnamed protein product [Symbiodinium sp. CCMP2592]|nr:unnamed protein product [Symbiodinium sp. CCMP2592]CAE7352046.1 unnamed protein product [Symbiodinium sp. CCMP2592]
MSMNIGGFTQELFDTFVEWLDSRCTMDLVIVQETHWGLGKEEKRWMLPNWLVISAPDPSNRYSARLAPERVSHVVWMPGRLLHLRYTSMQATLDIVAAYQYVWKGRDDARVQQLRHAFWTKLGLLLQGIPSRNVLVMGADLNSTCRPLASLNGRGILKAARSPDMELETLQKANRLATLNTWGRATPSKSRTFENGHILAQALTHAGLSEALTHAILGLHEQCQYEVQHEEFSGTFSMLKGVRQGCSLAPLLFAVFSCWLFDQIALTTEPEWAAKLLTLFADDSHLSFEISSMADLESAQRAAVPLASGSSAINVKVASEREESGGTQVPPPHENPPPVPEVEMILHMTMAVDEGSDMRASSAQEQLLTEGRPPKWSRPNGGKGADGWSEWRAQKRQWEKSSHSGDNRTQTAANDPKLQHLVTTLTRAVLRHEADLSLYRADTSYVIFVDTGSHSCLQQLKEAGDRWQEMFTKGTVDRPSSRLHTDEDKLECCKQAGWLMDGRTALDPAWRYHVWDPAQKCEVPGPTDPRSQSEILRDLETLQVRLMEDGVLLRFRATKDMDTQDAPVIPFMAAISLRTQGAQEAHFILSRLVGCACCKLAGFRIKPERGQRSQMSRQLEQAYLAVDFCEWGNRDQKLGAQGTLNVLECCAFRAVFRTWRELRRQHDAGEFWAQLCAALQPSHFAGQWQARLSEPLSVTDNGSLHMPILLDPIRSSLQCMIQAWQTQYAVHGLCEPTPMVCLQICRYKPDQRKDKTSVLIRPGAQLRLPCFDAAEVGTEVQTYRVGFVVFHLGETVRSGHYQVALSVPPTAPTSQDWSFQMCDDHRTPKPATKRDVRTLQTNAYQRCRESTPVIRVECLSGVSSSLRRDKARKHVLLCPQWLHVMPCKLPLCLSQSVKGWLNMQPGCIEIVPVPDDVYEDMLMSHLLLQSVCNLYVWETGNPPPAQLGLLAWNDLLLWAQHRLGGASVAALHQYADLLDVQYCGRAHSALPHPSWEDFRKSSKAERLAQHLLESGAGTLWHSARLVARLLELELPRQAYGIQRLCRQTLTHANTARILNALVLRVCPWHKWSTVALLYNLQTPVHLDAQNGPEPSLLMALSLHEGGEVWIEDETGSEYHEHLNGWLRGRRFSLQMQAVRFQAHRRPHFTCAWTGMERLVLTAYTVNKWESVAASHRAKLENLGFVLPAGREMLPVPPSLDGLPTVLREGIDQ